MNIHQFKTKLMFCQNDTEKQALYEQYPDLAAEHEERQSQIKRDWHYNLPPLPEPPVPTKIDIDGTQPIGTIIEKSGHKYRVTGHFTITPAEAAMLDDAQDVLIDSGTYSVAELVKKPERTESAYDVLAALVGGKSVEYIYSAHYYVYVTFTPDGTATIEDGDREAYTINPITDPCRTSVEETCNEIYTVLDAVQRALQVLPSGNIEMYGGKSGIIKTLYDAECINRHVAGLS